MKQEVPSLCVHQEGALQRHLYSGSFQHHGTDLKAQEQPEPAVAPVFAGCSCRQSWKADCLLGNAARWLSARRLSAEMELACSSPVSAWLLSRCCNSFLQQTGGFGSNHSERERRKDGLIVDGWMDRQMDV